MTTTVSVSEQKAMMAIDLVPLHPGLTEGIRALYGETSCLSTRCPPEEVHGWVQESIRRREADEEYSYAILRDTGLVGLCSLRGITSEPRTARLAYLIGRRHWHRGYATQATGMLIAFGFRCLTLDWIYSSCLPETRGRGGCSKSSGSGIPTRVRCPIRVLDRVNACCTSSSAGGSGRPGPHNDRRSHASTTGMTRTTGPRPRGKNIKNTHRICG
jgi:hypothetical protein